MRMQLNGEGVKGRGAYRNSLDCMQKVMAKDGVMGVQRGLTTAFYREAIHNIPRLGLYEPILATLRPFCAAQDGADTFLMRLMAAGVCGAVGGFVVNPAEIVKARVQSGRYAYGGPINGTRVIIREEGAFVMPNSLCVKSS